MAHLEVHMHGKLVGTLDGSDRRSLRCTYDPEYAADPASTSLSVSMPLRESPYSHATIHPYLWGLLPDNGRVLARWAREFDCSPGDAVTLLSGVDTDFAGAAQYLEPGTEAEESRPGEVVWVDGTATRVHQEDLCQALGVHPDKKYESDGGPRAADLGNAVREVASGADVLRLHDALAYH